MDSKENKKHLASSLALDIESTIPSILPTKKKIGKKQIESQDNIENLNTHRFMEDGSIMDIGMIPVRGVRKKENGNFSYNNQYGPIPIIKESNIFGPNTSQNAGSYEDKHYLFCILFICGSVSLSVLEFFVYH